MEIEVAVMDTLLEMDRLLVRGKMAAKAARRWTKTRPDRAHVCHMEANDCSLRVDSERSYLTRLVGWNRANNLSIDLVNGHVGGW